MRGLSNESQYTRSKKRAENQKHYPFKGTQNQHITRRTKNQCRHTLTALADYTSRLPKHTDITRSATQNMPRWHPLLVKNLCSNLSLSFESEISRLCGLLNSQPRPVHPCGQYHSWSAPQTTGTGGRTNATARKRVRPQTTLPARSSPDPAEEYCRPNSVSYNACPQITGARKARQPLAR